MSVAGVPDTRAVRVAGGEREPRAEILSASEGSRVMLSRFADLSDAKGTGATTETSW